MSSSKSIRARVVDYLDYKGLSRYRFYKDTGFSNGFLDKYGGITSDNCEKICYVYPDLNPEWLLTGRGDMLRPSYTSTYIEELKTKSKDVLIQDIINLSAEKHFLQQEVMDLLSRLAMYESPLNIAADSQQE